MLHLGKINPATDIYFLRESEDVVLLQVQINNNYMTTIKWQKASQ